MFIALISMISLTGAAITIGRRTWKDRGHNLDYVRPLVSMIGDRYNITLGAIVAIVVVSVDVVDGAPSGSVSGLIPAVVLGFGAAVLSRLIRDRIGHRS